MSNLPRYYCALRWNSGLTRRMFVLAAEEMPAAETGQMFAAETGQMFSVARTELCLVSGHNVEVSVVAIVSTSRCSTLR